MIDVVFAFDVEDVVNPASDDAALRLSQIFTEEEVPCSMFIAGEKARTMRQRGRRDVLAALSQHEVCTHGNYWADFPIPALVYGQEMPWDKAVKYALSVELPGLHDLAEMTGQFPVAWCCHQAQQSAPLQYALKLAGVRCWAGGPRGWIMNWLSWPRSNCVISNQGTCQQRVDYLHFDRLKPPADPEADLRAVQEQFEAMAQTRSFISFAGHPVCFVTSEWALDEWAVLFRKGVHGPFPRPAHFAPQQPRSPEDQEAAYTFVRKLLRWIKGVGGVNLTNYTQLCERDEEDPVQWLTWEQVGELAQRVLADFNYTTAFGTSFSCADMLGLFCFAVDYAWRNHCWPDRLPVQRLLGPTEPPLHLDRPLTIKREDIVAGAAAQYAIMMDERRLAGRLKASFTDVGPAEFLHVLAEFIAQSQAQGDMPLEVSIPAMPLYPKVVDEPAITERRFGSTSSPAGLSHEKLWEMLRWQAWSYRPAVARR
ncbi:hypothetical protein LLH23_13435 [bacterium]|nr:hypothetical protein [bacterium]